jgi:hypothetical protein
MTSKIRHLFDGLIQVRTTSLTKVGGLHKKTQERVIFKLPDRRDFKDHIT